MMHRRTRLQLTELNSLLTCFLCKGYLIDATTLTECLHSFCRSCLVRYLHTSHNCPKCDTLVHKTRPLLNARIDRALQNIVYKLVPGLFKDEMKKRRDFYAEHPQAAGTSSPSDLEARGEVSDRALIIYTDDEHMNLSLEYFLPYGRKRSAENQSEDESSAKRTRDVLEEESEEEGDENEMIHKRYLRCPAAVCVKHIKKFIRSKFDLQPKYQIELTHVDNEEDPLPDDYTLMDVAYIYAWRRIGPLPLVFRVFHETNKRQKINHITEPTIVPEKVPDNESEHDQRTSPAEKETPSDEETASVPVSVPSPKTIIIDDEKDEVLEDRTVSRKTEEKTVPRRTEIVNLTEGGTFRVSSDIDLTEKHLLPKLRLPMMNIFQTTGAKTKTLENSLQRTMVDDSPASDKSKCVTHVAIVDDRRLLLDEIVKEKIKMTLLNNNDQTTETEKSTDLVGEHEHNGGDLSMKLNQEVIPLDAPSTLSSPVVSVR